MRRSTGYLLAVCTALCASRATAAAAGGPASFYLTRQQPFRSVETVASRPAGARGEGPTPQLKQGFDWCAARYPLSEDYFPPKENAELVLVQVVTRHGDRTPLSSHTYQDVTWDCDGDNQFSFLTSNLTGIRPDRALVSRELVAIPIAGPYSFGTWSGSCDVGQLTPRGAAYQREIGEELRKIYIDRLQFLPKTFNESAGLYVRSAALGRTKQSASRLISGLYPNAFRPDDSVINLVTVPTNIEYMTRNYEHCPRQAKLVKKMARSKEFRKHLQRNKSLWKKLRSILGEPHNPGWPARSFLAYLDYLVPRRCHLLPLPCNRRLTSCLTEKDVDSILDNAHWEFEHLFRDGDHAEEFTRATTGPFLAELRDSVFRHAKAASERGSAKHPRYNDGSEDLSNSAFELYSAHEETIAALLGAFKAKYVHVPPYSSNIVVELWRDPAGAGVPGGYDDFFVRIFYNGKIVEVPWCDLNACPVEWVWQYTKPLIPDDVQTECGTKYFKGDSDGGDLDDLDDAMDPDVGADPAAVFAA